jgi:hypothetical protein
MNNREIRMRKLITAAILALLVMCSLFACGTDSAIEKLMISDTPGDQSTSGWVKTFGGNKDDYANAVKQTADGGYIFAGLTSSGAEEANVYLVKVDADGNEQWSKSIGSTYAEQAQSMQLTADGGYIVAGWISVPEPDWHTDVFLLKTDAMGNELWTKTFGGNYNDEAESIQLTDDGGYIITGETKTEDKRFFSMYLIKTDADGNEIWSRTYSNSEDSRDTASSVQLTADTGYIIAGYTDIMGLEGGNIYVIKTDGKGKELWSRKFGGDDDSQSTSMQCTSDGGYIITGWRDNNGGLGTSEIILLKIDTDGNEIWYRAYDEIYGWAADVQQTPDGGYIIAAVLYSGEIGGSDTSAIDANACLIKTDSKGNMLWIRKLGSDFVRAIELTEDGGYIIAGSRLSSDGILNHDAYILKTDSSGNFRPEED